MRSMVGLLLAAVVTGALVAGVLPMHAPEAQAITVRHRTHSSDDGGVSARDRAELTLAATMIVKSRKGGTKKGNRSMALNYKNLDRYDKGKTIMRRQLAAAWLAGGGSLYNVSTAERRRVNVYRKQPGGRCSACVRADSADRLPTAPPSSGRCTGRSDKHYAYSGIPLIPTAAASTPGSIHRTEGPDEASGVLGRAAAGDAVGAGATDDRRSGAALQRRSGFGSCRDDPVVRDLRDGHRRPARDFPLPIAQDEARFRSGRNRSSRLILDTTSPAPERLKHPHSLSSEGVSPCAQRVNHRPTASVVHKAHRWPCDFHRFPGPRRISGDISNVSSGGVL